MTKLLAFSACVAALVAALAWPGNADPARTTRQGSGTGVTAADVDANLRRSGLAPRGEIIRHGDVFVTHAVDPRGIEVRVVAEALFGDIVSVAPRHLMVPYPARYDSGPRIIHIPGRGGDVRAALPGNDTALDQDDDDAPVAAVPRVRERDYRDHSASQPRRQSSREPRRLQTREEPRRAPRQVLPYETPYKSRQNSREESRQESRQESRRETAKPQAKLELKANRSVLAIPPTPVEPPATPRWQAPEKFGAPPDHAAPPSPLASKSAEAAQASANEPAVAPPAAVPPAVDNDTPPESVTVDPAPAQ
ncbi:MAG: hypothetical protein AB7O50_08255 [Pseudolabrys sp.]